MAFCQLVAPIDLVRLHVGLAAELGVGGGLNQDLQNYKWNPLWLYMRLWDVKRFFEIFSVLTLHRPPQISEKWGKMAHFGRFPTFSYWLVWSLNY